jgi:protein arginine N-methyltransferase 5
MSYSDGMDGTAPIFYVGHHETKRSLDVSPELVQHAQDLGVSDYSVVLDFT